MNSNDQGSGNGAEWCRRHRVAPHLRSLFYLPDYVVPEQEAQLLREVRASKAKWIQLSGRRLQNLGGVVHPRGLIPAPLPNWLQPLLGRLAAEGGEGGLYGGQPPNHVLVNSYMPGEGIMPHEDGPAYHPVVAILSLGAPAVLRFRRKQRPEGANCPTDEANGGRPPPTEPAAAGAPEMQQPLGAPQPPPPPPPPPPPLRDPQPQPLQDPSADEADAGAGATEAGSESGAGATEATAGSEAWSGSGAGSSCPPPLHPSPSPSSSSSPCPYTASVLLQPRSLVVFREEAFTECLHSIEEVGEELLDETVANLDMYGMCPGMTLSRGGERISLTVRRVARVLPTILRR